MVRPSRLRACVVDPSARMSNISSPGCDAQPDDIVYQSESPSSAGHCRNGRPGHGPRPILTARRPARIGRTPVEANVSLTSPPVAANSNLASAQFRKTGRVLHAAARHRTRAEALPRRRRSTATAVAGSHSVTGPVRRTSGCLIARTPTAAAGGNGEGPPANGGPSRTASQWRFRL